MMKLITPILIFLFAFGVTYSQQAIKVLSMKGYGGDSYDQINLPAIKTFDGGFIVVIGSQSDSGTGNIDTFCAKNGERDISLKYNADGTILEWTKCYLATGDSAFGWIFPTHDGGFVLIGSYGFPYGFPVCKENASVSVIWKKDFGRVGGANIKNVMSHEDGGYIIASLVNNIDTDATTHHGSSFTEDIWVLKIDSNGNKVWSKVIGGTGDEWIDNIVPGPNGGCYIVGETESNDYDCTGNHGNVDAYIVRLDSSGNILWHKDLGGSDADGYHGQGIINGKGGIIFTTGTRSSDGDVHHYAGNGNSEFWTVDLDSNGNIIWDNCYGDSSDAIPESICKATDGSLWMAGSSTIKSGEVDMSFGKGDAWVVHTDSMGQFIDAKVFGTHQTDGAQIVYPLENGLVLVGGYYDTASINGEDLPTIWYGGSDIFLTVLASWPVNVPKLPENSNTIAIYPNPANTKVSVNYIYGSSCDCKRAIVFYNVLGRELFREEVKTITGTVSFPTNGLMPGSYIIRMEEDGNALHMGHVSVVH